ncbi:MAG TPA: hypothetical protein VE243_09975 [Candidatus Acidoferrum sp.]|nr:hypothetical protein [Candidatus Acidoferrum sp.]
MFIVRPSTLGLIAALCLVVVGCLYPPVTQPPPETQQEVVIPLPYDLAWDAVNAVITENSFHVQAQDMTNGIIEAVGPRFTLHDADCGKIKSVAGAYTAEPEVNSSSVYNFLVRTRGPEATIVEVRATFNSSVDVPLHPATDVDCVSHGIQESNLLREVLVEAKKTHRPAYAKPGGSEQPAAAGAQAAGPSTASGPVKAPSSIDRGETHPAPPPSSHGYSLIGHSSLPDLPAPAPH